MSGKPTRMILGGHTLAGSLRTTIDAMNLPENRGTVVVVDSADISRDDVDAIYSIVGADVAQKLGATLVVIEPAPKAEPPDLFPPGYFQQVRSHERPNGVWPQPPRLRRSERQSVMFKTHRLPNARARKPVPIRRR
jgi:hypothetical protein